MHCARTHRGLCRLRLRRRRRLLLCRRRRCPVDISDLALDFEFNSRPAAPAAPVPATATIRMELRGCRWQATARRRRLRRRRLRRRQRWAGCSWRRVVAAGGGQLVGCGDQGRLALRRLRLCGGGGGGGCGGWSGDGCSRRLGLCRMHRTAMSDSHSPTSRLMSRCMHRRHPPRINMPASSNKPVKLSAIFSPPRF